MDRQGPGIRGPVAGATRMQEPRGIREGVVDSLGWACLVASLLLLSTGVRAVRAGDDDPAAFVSTDPVLVEALERDGTEVPPAAPSPSPRPTASPREGERTPRAGGPAQRTAPGVVVLNTRGYNYGPRTPTPLDPATPSVESPAE